MNDLFHKKFKTKKELMEALRKWYFNESFWDRYEFCDDLIITKYKDLFDEKFYVISYSPTSNKTKTLGKMHAMDFMLRRKKDNPCRISLDKC